MGTLGGVSGSFARGLNASGEVVGNSNGRAFLYRNGMMKDLDPRAPGNTVAYGINAKGQVVGASSDAVGNVHAFLHSGGITSDLGFQYGGEALAINANGLVVGWFTDRPCTQSAGCPGNRHPFLYRGGMVIGLGGAHTSSSVANGINASGEVVGEFPINGGPPHAFLYRDGVMTDLGTLGGAYSNANAINDSGQVVGSSQVAGTFESHAFLYSGGTMTDLGTFATCADLYGGSHTYTSSNAANAINSSGQIVGSSSCTYFDKFFSPRVKSRPWVYSGGTMRDLQNLIDPASGWTIFDASGINDAGQIAASGCNAYTCNALLLTPSQNATAVEYYDAQLDHYFMTADATEIAALDAGHFPGWMRTGQQFPVYVAGLSAGPIPGWLEPVCRYYGLPGAGLDTHFFSASVEECAAVAAKWPLQWRLETPNAFYLYLPNTTDGSCPSGTVEVYRLFNDRPDVNHRYTASLAIRQQMIDAGWIPEGYGKMAVGMCVIAF